ncbi:glucan 1,3-beta-glucosidase [Phakopsora pachyrhizi]|nr:glucan 1,3-beta-glucosidase [Phakopsora pachyrhizi]
MGLFHSANSKAPNTRWYEPTHSDPSALPLPAKGQRRRSMLVLALLLLIALAIAIGIVVGIQKLKSHSSNSSSGSIVTADGRIAQLWGVGGDKITTDSGSTFIYNNTLGGTWVAIPFNDSAKCQDDSPPLSEPWDYSSRRIYGVNLGGWLVLEPFIVPYLFEKFNPDETTDTPPTVVDEWSLSTALGKDLASTLEEHYKTFITEEDFAQIAAAGLNWVRLPVGWWMIETWEDEPMLSGVSYKYFLKALKWARKYGLRVNLDLHAVPGSQNGYNHSGRWGSINFLVGLMGIANAQRSFNYIRTLTQFISQPEYSNVVPMFSVLNEPLVQKIGSNQIRSYYLQVYQMMRNITGFGLGKGPMMVIHDGFNGLGAGHTGWGGFLKGADRLGLDTHTYFAFDKQSNDSLGYNSFKPCAYWAKSFNQTNTEFGFNFAGEYSLAINDCGLWLNNIGVGSRYDGTYPNSTAPDLKNFPAVGTCDFWKNYLAWGPDVKESIADLAFSAQDAMQNSFFWTWKISHSIRSKSGLKPNPMWDYQLGLKEGWIRPDARRSIGGCAIVAAKQGLTAPVQQWSGLFEDWQVGSKNGSASSIDASELARYGQWPPSAITIKQGEDPMYTNVANLPQYVPNGEVVKLKAEPPQKSEYPTGAIIGTGGDGWANDNDKSGWYVPVKGCKYPNPWAGGGLPQPTEPFCGGSTASASAASSTAAATP